MLTLSTIDPYITNNFHIAELNFQDINKTFEAIDSDIGELTKRIERSEMLIIQLEQQLQQRN